MTATTQTLVKLAPRLALLPIRKHNSAQARASVLAWKTYMRQAGVVVACELTSGEASFIVNQKFRDSEFYPVLCDPGIRTVCVDLPIAVSAQLSYPECQHPLVEYCGDRIFTGLINRHGIRSQQLPALRRFTQTFYTNREEHMCRQVRKLQSENPLCEVLLICGAAHLT